MALPPRPTAAPATPTTPRWTSRSERVRAGTDRNGSRGWPRSSAATTRTTSSASTTTSRRRAERGAGQPRARSGSARPPRRRRARRAARARPRRGRRAAGPAARLGEQAFAAGLERDAALVEGDRRLERLAAGLELGHGALQLRERVVERERLDRGVVVGSVVGWSSPPGPSSAVSDVAVGVVRCVGCVGHALDHAGHQHTQADPEAATTTTTAREDDQLHRPADRGVSDRRRSPAVRRARPAAGVRPAGRGLRVAHDGTVVRAPDDGVARSSVACGPSTSSARPRRSAQSGPVPPGAATEGREHVAAGRSAAVLVSSRAGSVGRIDRRLGGRARAVGLRRRRWMTRGRPVQEQAGPLTRRGEAGRRMEPLEDPPLGDDLPAGRPDLPGDGAVESPSEAARSRGGSRSCPGRRARRPRMASGRARRRRSRPASRRPRGRCRPRPGPDGRPPRGPRARR